MINQWFKLINNNTMRLGITYQGLENYSLLRFENFDLNKLYKKNNTITYLRYKKGIKKKYIIPCDGYIKDVNYELLQDLKKLNVCYSIYDSELWLFDIDLYKNR